MVHNPFSEIRNLLQITTDSMAVGYPPKQTSSWDGNFQTHLKKIEDHVQQAKTSTQRAQTIQRETKKKDPEHQHQQQQQQKTHSKTQAFSNAKKTLEETRTKKSSIQIN